MPDRQAEHMSDNVSDWRPLRKSNTPETFYFPSPFMCLRFCPQNEKIHLTVFHVLRSPRSGKETPKMKRFT